MAIPSSDVRSEWATDLCVNSGLIGCDVEGVEARGSYDPSRRHRPILQSYNRGVERGGNPQMAEERDQRLGGDHDEDNLRGSSLPADAAPESDEVKSCRRKYKVTPIVGLSSDGRVELLAGGPLARRGLGGGATRGAASSGARGLEGSWAARGAAP